MSNEQGRSKRPINSREHLILSRWTDLRDPHAALPQWQMIWPPDVVELHRRWRLYGIEKPFDRTGTAHKPRFSPKERLPNLAAHRIGAAICVGLILGTIASAATAIANVILPK